MLQALQAVDDPHFRAQLFNNALEEVHHAALFADLARSYADAPQPLAASARKRLFDPAAGLAQFEAYHFVGEVDVYEQFLSYAAAAHLEDIRTTFLEIRGDEAEHQKLAYDQLVKMVGSEKKVHRMIRNVRLTRALEQWERFSRGLSDLMCSAVLSALYLAFAPFSFIGCRRCLYERVSVSHPISIEPDRTPRPHPGRRSLDLEAPP
jgi:hypothetical protein